MQACTVQSQQIKLLILLSLNGRCHWALPLETPKFRKLASPRGGAASSRENIVSGDGTACKWQHTDTLMMMFPVCHPLSCTEAKQMAHFPQKLDFLFLCKDRMDCKDRTDTTSLWLGSMNWGVFYGLSHHAISTPAG